MNPFPLLTLNTASKFSFVIIEFDVNMEGVQVEGVVGAQ